MGRSFLARLMSRIGRIAKIRRPSWGLSSKVGKTTEA
jgi:hypothetical protein